MEVTSNATLCDLFEAFISRFDKMADRLDIIDARIAATVISRENKFEFHTFPCSSFSGLAFCGRSVVLHVNNIRFDTDGVFDTKHAAHKHIFFLTTPDVAFCGLYLSSQWEFFPNTTSYDEDLREIWGVEEYKAIRLRIENYHSTKSHVTCENIGIKSRHFHIGPAIYEIVMKHRFPAFVAIGTYGIALDCEKISDIKTAVRVMDCASKLFGQHPCKYIQINQVENNLGPLGIAYLQAIDLTEAFKKLGHSDQTTVLNRVGKTLFGNVPRVPVRKI